MSCEDEKKEMDDERDLRDEYLKEGSDAFSKLSEAQSKTDDAWDDLVGCGYFTAGADCGSDLSDYLDKSAAQDEAQDWYDSVEMLYKLHERELAKKEKAYCKCKQNEEGPED